MSGFAISSIPCEGGCGRYGCRHQRQQQSPSSHARMPSAIAGDPGFGSGYHANEYMPMNREKTSAALAIDLGSTRFKLGRADTAGQADRRVDAVAAPADERGDRTRS